MAVKKIGELIDNNRRFRDDGFEITDEYVLFELNPVGQSWAQDKLKNQPLPNVSPKNIQIT